MGTLSACFGMGTYIGLTIYLPVYFEAVRGLSASQSGLALIPLMVGTVAGATASGRVMSHVGNYKRLPFVGLASHSWDRHPGVVCDMRFRSPPSKSCWR